MQNTILEINRSDHSQTRLVEQPLADCGPGQVRLRVDRFALTANNITYAVAGDMLGYWDFFPAEAGWGRVPAMGWADVVESASPDVAVGGRYYGWFPMAQYITFDAAVTADGFRDDGEHRAGHAAVYRSYQRTDKDPWYQEGSDAEDRHALLRGLFLTGFLAEEFFADAEHHGAEQVLVLSASSKTAIGFAQCAAQRGDVSVVGLTSPTNADFVSSLGFYDETLVYEDIASIATAPSVAIDMSGNSGVVAALHGHLGDAMRYSMAVGMSHHDATPAAVTAGPKPQMFFAPSEVARRVEEWGRAAYAERTTEALQTFVHGSADWLTVRNDSGPDAAAAAWDDVRSGGVAPSVGVVVSMHAEDGE
jgi:NADPH:quinone reductase-like Zn-dependent oxidoreductase